MARKRPTDSRDSSVEGERSRGPTLGVARQRPLVPDPAGPIGAAYLRSAVRHPLVYRKRIERVEKARPGDLVAVYAPGDRLLGYGLYNPRSEIAVRMLFFGAELPDEAAWQRRLDAAVSLRREVLHLDDATDAYRVIHAEADGLSGLVVDRLGDVLSAEVYTLGMYQRATAVLERLSAGLGTRHALVRPSPQFLSQEGCQPPEIALGWHAPPEGASPGHRPVTVHGDCPNFRPTKMGLSPSADLPAEVTIREFGTRFRVCFASGHKTGFFCDQRENRRRLADFCRGRSLLDLCCYTGGFALQAKCLGQAADVTGVDLDEEPLRLARENANLNHARIRFVQDDAFAYMREMLRQDRQYDVVVLDPPKLVRTRTELAEGTRKHFDLNRLAMRLVRPGGLMLSCCCSGLLPEAEFLKLLRAAAAQSGQELPTAPDDSSTRHAARSMQVLARSGAAADHPVSASVPETEYLKAAWLRLE